jgi:hypothetical protein
MNQKSSKHLIMSNVECANNDCRKVNGLNGNGPRKFIKQSVVDRMGTDRPLYCYKCSKDIRLPKSMKVGR